MRTRCVIGGERLLAKKGVGMSNEDVVSEDREELTREELTQFGFTARPFEHTKQTVSLPSWQTQFQLMQHMLLYSNSILSMTSDESTGKTTFINELINFLPESFICHRLEATSYLDPSTLRLQMIQWFALNSIGDLFNDEVAYIISQLTERNQHCLLIIDDAERLSQGCLEMLFEYAAKQDENAFFHVFLVGSEPLSLHLEPVIEKYPGDLSYAFELPLISLDETLLYLKDRLRQAGFHEAFPLSETVVRAIYEQAQGKFEVLDYLAYEALVQALRQPKAPFPKIDLHAYRWPSMMLLSLVVAVISIKPFLAREPEEIRRLALPEKKTPSPILVSNHSGFDFDEPLSSVAEKSNENLENVKPAHVTVIKPRQLSHKKKVVQIKKVTSNKHGRRKPAKRSVAKRKALVKTSSPSIETQIRAIKSARQTVRERRVVVMDSLVHMPKPVRLLEQSQQRHYGIQLLASSNLFEVKSFIKKHQLKNAKIIKKQLDNKTWYSLVVGRYSSRQKASIAIKHLPKHLRQFKPWVSAYERSTVIHRVG